MKILWFSHILPYPPKGGVFQRSYHLIKELSKKHKVYLIAINHMKLNDISSSINHLKQFCDEVEVINLPLGIFQKYFKALSSFLSLTPYTACWLQIQNKNDKNLIRQFIQKFNIDIVHFDSIDVANYLEEANELPKVLNHHNIESQMMLRRLLKEKNLFKKLFFSWEAIKLKKYEKKICPKFTYNLVVSELDKKRLLKICPNIMIEVIPNGVDIDYFIPTNQNYESKTLIFAGGMTWYPNRDAMLFFCKKIWPLLKKKWPDAKMYIIGRNPPKYILRLSQKDPHLIVTGFVDDVRPYLEKAHVYVCPIRDGGGTKLKVLDALAMGKPIIAHPISIEGIDVELGRHVLSAENPIEFVNQIERLFEDHNLCVKFSQEGRRLVAEKYDFKKIGEKLAQLYERIN